SITSIPRFVEVAMMNRCVGGLLAGSTVLVLTAMTFVQAPAPNDPPAQKGKEPFFPSISKGFDGEPDGIPRGKVEAVEYDSKTTGKKRTMLVYTPPGYAKSNKYPVFYLLHGLGGNEKNWTQGGSAQNILDNLYADKKIEMMIVVMPNGMVTEAGK